MKIKQNNSFLAETIHNFWSTIWETVHHREETVDHKIVYCFDLQK